MSQPQKIKKPEVIPEKVVEDVSYFGKPLGLFSLENVSLVKGHVYALDQEPVKKPGSSNIAKKLGL